MIAARLSILLIAAASAGCAHEASAGQEAATPIPAAGPARGAASPEAAWEKARSAFRSGAFREYIESVSPEAHDECLCFIVWVIAMERHGEGLTSARGLREMNEILSRHGAAEIGREHLGPGAGEKPGLSSRRAIHRIEDKVGLYADMMASIARRGRIWGHGELPAWMRVDLEDLRVQGDQATATLPGHGRVGFDRIGGAWFLHPRNSCLDDVFRGEAAP